MAESRRQPRMRCQIHFLPDRHVLQKLSQVYQRLVPQPGSEAMPEPTELTAAQRAKDRSHLRPSFF